MNTSPTFENNPETTLRQLWDKQGIPRERQDAILADLTAKAQPGAQVGPFTIPDRLDGTMACKRCQTRGPLEQAVPNTTPNGGDNTGGFLCRDCASPQIHLK